MFLARTAGLIAGPALFLGMLAPPALAEPSRGVGSLADAVDAQPAFDASAFALRHGQLSLHQGFGLGTLAVMALTAGLGYYVAELDGSDAWRDAHLAMGGLSTGMYLTTATLALTAPHVGGEETEEGPWDTVGLHRKLGWLHMAGMASTVGLGLASAFGGSRFQPYHEAAAFGTLGVMALSAGVVAFGE